MDTLQLLQVVLAVGIVLACGWGLLVIHSMIRERAAEIDQLRTERKAAHKESK